MAGAGWIYIVSPKGCARTDRGLSNSHSISCHEWGRSQAVETIDTFAASCKMVKLISSNE